MKYTVSPSRIKGHVEVPPSKSHTLRALVFALMAEGDSIIRNYLRSPDTLVMIEAIRKFGAAAVVEEDAIYVTGVGKNLKQPDDIIDAGNSGLVFRLIAGIAALCNGFVVITGDQSIRTRRPIKPLLDSLTSQNIFAESLLDGGRGPIIIKGPLKAGCFSISGFDSQPVSSLLIASAFLDGCSEIYVMNPGERPWIDMTVSWLSKFDIQVINADYRYYWISGKARYNGFEIVVPGDFSTAAFSIAAAVVTKDVVTLSGLDMDDVQGDKRLLDILSDMGVIIEYDHKGLLCIDGRGDIKGIEVDVNDFVDAFPILSVICCYAQTPSTIRGAEVCRKKESDRISAMAQELSKMGVELEEFRDGLKIYPSKIKGAHVDGHKDHRIIMSLIIAALGADSPTIVDGVEYIAKTYPTFLYDFLSMGGRIE